ncbi:SOUL family heme-binding protein [Dichotomicrobium thermohalophilum]|uniref:SOUL heme-binding protein n=1 Tax=Dichotomicrobium thermohalophilum TaxID=933063 RepID=A0A397QAK3_9HYPH|nr:heme-binding protein [Dichotomicrobium thermohalophilum]RIA55154.1 SOUL heme-binding protein [Dichotomicrobium thermohalophilum]
MSGKRVLWIIGGAIVAVIVVAIGAWIIVTQNIETPDYESVVQDGSFEIRDYPEMIVAEVRRTGTRDKAVREAFEPLADYIFARERGGDSISMTAPVTQEPTDKIAMTAPVTQTQREGEWVVRFIMPAKYSMDELPAPGSDVTLERIPPERRAAIRFSGSWDTELFSRKTEELRKWLAERGVEPTGPPTYAYYNDPFTPGFLRRNEVLFDIPPDAS